MTTSIEDWKKRFERERTARNEAEKILEARAADLIQSNESMIQEYQSLEDIVYERTVALEELNKKLRKEITRGKNIEKQLVIARDDALKDVEKKSQFLARVSHDIRTPLNSIVGYTGLIKRESLTELQTTHLSRIESSTWVLLRVIGDLLDMTKMDADKMELYYKSCKIKDLLRSTLALISPTAEQKGIELKLIASKNLPELVYFDPNRFQQILINLLSNAVKFTDNGSIVVTVGLKNSPKIKIPKYDASEEDIPENLDVGILTVKVEDTGIGIAESSLANVFEPFLQISEAGTDKEVGSGLGLAICKKMVGLMGGVIKVTSEVSVGTKFKFSLPCRYTESQDKSANASQNINITETDEVKSEASKPQISSVENMSSDFPLSILIADDYEPNRMVLEAQLDVMGYPADLVCNGEEVLRALKERTYDLILMDIRMPVLDGMQTTRIIRKKENIHQPYIIAVTASAIQGDKEKFIECGINDYVSKPVFADALSDALKKAYETSNSDDGNVDTLIAQFDDSTTRIGNFDAVILEDLEERLGPAAKAISLKVFPVFIRELPTREKKILSSYKKHDVENFREVCHGLKGSSRSVGAKDLGDLCEKFEILAHNGELPEAVDINMLINSAKATKTALTNKLEELKSS